MKKIKKWILLVLSSALLINLISYKTFAQVSYSNINIQGNSIRGVNLYGAEYIGLDNIRSFASVQIDSNYVYIESMGHMIVMPIDEDAYRATTNYNTIQLDSIRQNNRTATYIDNIIHVPLEIIAKTIGANYSAGNMTLPSKHLDNVSSSADTNSDRLVLDLSSDTEVYTELKANYVYVTMKNTSGTEQRYTTSGQYISNARVMSSNGDLKLRFVLPKDSGYKMFKIIRPGSVRVVIDAGPEINKTDSYLTKRIAKPLIIIEPKIYNNRRENLELANSTAKLLKEAGWQVEIAQKDGKNLSLEERIQLARKSDVYIIFDFALLGEDKTSTGLTLYTQAADHATEYSSNIRKGREVAYGKNAVSDGGGSKILLNNILDELKDNSLNAKQANINRALSLSEAQQAAILVETGNPKNHNDLEKITDSNQKLKISISVARAAANYLSRKANNVIGDN